MDFKKYKVSAAIIYMILLSIRSVSLAPEYCKNACNCYTIETGSVVECPALTSDLKIWLLYENSWITMECNKLTPNELLNILPQLNINAETLELSDCVLPANLSISTVLQKLAVGSIQQLFLTGQTFELNITKYHLSDLYGLKNIVFNKLSKNAVITEDLFTDYSLNELNELTFYSKTIPPKLFENLENLDKLYIKGVSHPLPTDVFHNLGKLRLLSIESCNLQNATNDLFKPLKLLNNLIIEDSIFGKPEPKIFSFLENLNSINLNSNVINSLPLNLFKYNTALNVFLLTDDKDIKMLPSEMLAGFNELNAVYILETSLRSIPGNLFNNSNNIEIINLSKNKFEDIPSNLFETQFLLETLDLSYNNLSYLPKYLFDNATNLNKIDLSNNNLWIISSYNFKYLFKLEFLSLKNNHLFFDNIHFNNSYGYKLYDLDLSDNYIEHIPQNLPITLKVLNLSGNIFTFLNGMEIRSLAYFNTIINLTDNEIQTFNFEDVIYWNFNLKLILNQNPISCDCNILNVVKIIKGEANSNILERLKFDVNNLFCERPNNLKGASVKNLDPLNLVCEMEKCAVGCKCWSRPDDKILIINCSNSSLTSVPVLPIIENTNFIGIELNLENNKLKTLPFINATGGYANVTKLIVAGNNLEEIDSSQLPYKLTYLDLRRNKLQILNDKTLEFLNNSKIIKVNLTDNHWQCNCEAKDMLRYIQRNPTAFVDYFNMTCANTSDVIYFHDLQLVDLCPDIDKYLITIAMILFAFGLVLASLIALYYKYHQEFKVWLYARNMCLWFVTENELDRNKKFDAFVSYSSKDEDFIYDHLIPELEDGSPAFKLCVYDRDWLLGAYIPDQIIYSIKNSRRTIVVLSQNFINSVWGQMEFKAAHRSALNEGRSRTIDL